MNDRSYSNLILFDPDDRDDLLPLTFTRPVGDLRVGILRIFEKWEHLLSAESSFLTQDYLHDLYPTQVGEKNLLINGSCLPDRDLLKAISQLEMGKAISYDGQIIAAKLDEQQYKRWINGGHVDSTAIDADLTLIKRPADIFSHNSREINRDYKLLTQGELTVPLPDYCQLVGSAEKVFIAPDASIEPCIINTEDGPVYIGKGAKILAGTMLRGPLAVGDKAVVKMGAKIYGGTTIGPACKVGGEVSNVVFYGNSNKGHDGYLGNSVVGEWCNFGADTNCSNLKNDYSEVRVWSYVQERFLKTGLQFHGLIMGDHAKCAINTMFNTGTMVGVFANVFGDGFPRPFVPDFSWGGKATYRLDQALLTAERVMIRRGQTLSEPQKQMLAEVFEQTKKWRRE
ncbi:MAG: putative sugar nucleotidyl transferase [Bacteroidota bacterium]